MTIRIDSRLEQYRDMIEHICGLLSLTSVEVNFSYFASSAAGRGHEIRISTLEAELENMSVARILAHELKHCAQVQSGELVGTHLAILWRGEVHLDWYAGVRSAVDHYRLPWEHDANQWAHDYIEQHAAHAESVEQRERHYYARLVEPFREVAAATAA